MRELVFGSDEVRVVGVCVEFGDVLQNVNGQDINSLSR